MDQPTIERNGPDGLQIQWDGVLITIGPNAEHGIRGSIAIKNDEGVHIVPFHGVGSACPTVEGEAVAVVRFPLIVHPMQRMVEVDPSTPS